MSAQTIDFVVSTRNEELLTITGQPKQVVIPALSKITIDSFFTCSGKYLPSYKNTGFIKINAVIDGVTQDKEHFIKVVVKKAIDVQEDAKIKVFDGRQEELSVYQYQWNQWDDPLSTQVISEGSGNGNGILPHKPGTSPPQPQNNETCMSCWRVV